MADEQHELKPRHRPPTPALYPTELPQRLDGWLAAAKANLAEPFKGVTADGNVIPGLFPMRKTGVSLQSAVDAALAFMAVLDPDRKAAAMFDVDSEAWRTWSNLHPFVMRHGVCLEELNADQREAALALVRECMSAAGFATARGVMKLNEHIRELTGRTEEFGEWYYWMSLLGAPSPSEPWGWQLDGHHLTVSCFVLGDQIVLTPTFLGSEPVVAKTGKYAGTRVFESEEARGLALMNALTPEQQQRATIGMQMPADVLATAFRDNLVIAYQGVPYREMTDRQRRLLLDLIAVYVGCIRPGHAEIKLEEVEAHLPDTYFAWIGHHDDTSPFYYRVQSPVILIEFDHQSGTALANDSPSRNHVHTLVRTPNGNDFGRDLLRQHYERFDHSHPHTPHRLGRE